MRILFWLLLAANVGLWMWTRWEAPLPERPQTPIHARELKLLSSPGVSLTPRFTSASPQSSGGTAPEESAGTPAPALASTCYEASALAPAQLVPIKQRLKTLKLGYRIRTRVRSVYQVAALPLSQHAYVALRSRLQALKITGTYRLTTHHGVRVSFGVFRNRKDAARETARLLRRGLRVRIRAMKRPVTSIVLAPITGAPPPALARLSPLLHQIPCARALRAVAVPKHGGSSPATSLRPQSGTVPHRPHATAR